MSKTVQRADAHIHLFDGGYKGDSFAKRPGVILDEAQCYASLAEEYNVSTALVVGYAGTRWCQDNNAYIQLLARDNAWIQPVVYVDPIKPPDVDQLERWSQDGFVGLSVYIFDHQAIEALQAIPDRAWAWLTEHRWLVSVNARCEYWPQWRPILQRFAELRLLISHLGLPPKLRQAPDKSEVKRAMSNILQLADFPGPRVKLSGFYALTDPGHDYPHEPAWPYAKALLDAYGTDRLVWGSDFSPCLDWVTFPQTFELFNKMPFLGDQDRKHIEGGNLLALLAEIVR